MQPGHCEIFLWLSQKPDILFSISAHIQSHCCIYTCTNKAFDMRDSSVKQLPSRRKNVFQALTKILSSDLPFLVSSLTPRANLIADLSTNFLMLSVRKKKRKKKQQNHYRVHSPSGNLTNINTHSHPSTSGRYASAIHRRGNLHVWDWWQLRTTTYFYKKYRRWVEAEQTWTIAVWLWLA